MDAHRARSPEDQAPGRRDPAQPTPTAPATCKGGFGCAKGGPRRGSSRPRAPGRLRRPNWKKIVRFWPSSGRSIPRYSRRRYSGSSTWSAMPIADIGNRSRKNSRDSGWRNAKADRDVSTDLFEKFGAWRRSPKSSVRSENGAPGFPGRGPLSRAGRSAPARWSFSRPLLDTNSETFARWSARWA